MKRLFSVLLLFFILLLVGCKTQNAPPAVQEGTTSSSSSSSEPRAHSEEAATQTGDAAEQTAPNSENRNEISGGTTNDSPSETYGSQGAQPTYPAPTGEPWVADMPTERNDPVELDGLRFTSFGRYSGAYVEDGSNDPVEDVAIVLVVNTGERFLEYASVSFEIDGEPATFTVTNLPPQRGDCPDLRSSRRQTCVRRAPLPSRKCCPRRQTGLPYRRSFPQAASLAVRK